MEEIQEQEDEDEDEWESIYGTMSNDEIRERVLKTLTKEMHLHNKVKQWLATDVRLFPMIRQHASLLAKYSSLKMELELYRSYRQMTESLLDWLSTMSKKLIRCYNINDQFFRIQTFIDEHLKLAEQQFPTIEEKLAKSLPYQQRGVASSEIDMRLITSLIVMFVRDDEQQGNVEYVKKRHLLLLNAKDIRLVHDFFHLQPSIRQLTLAERIWDLTTIKHRAKATVQNNQRPILTVANCEQLIDNHKKSFLTADKDDEERQSSLPTNYSKLNIDLLMHIIESRQKILLQRLEFHADFQKIFTIDDNSGGGGGDDDRNEREDDHDKRALDN